MSVLSPSVVAAIDDLEVVARTIVEGLRVGGNRSPFHGYGAEFQQYRPYRAGDDLKHLDWKMYARSDRLYTRQFRETTNLSMLLVLDTSASMAYPPDGVTKWRYSAVMAAALSWLVVDQGNAVGLLMEQEGHLEYLPPRSSRQHLRALLAMLERVRPSGSWHGASLIRRGAELLRRRGLVMTLSDFYDDEIEVRRAMREVVQQGHDVAMLQVLSGEEINPSWSGQVELEDAEGGARTVVNASAARPAYEQSIRAFLERCRAEALHDGVDYAFASTDVQPERVLRDFLLQRRR